MQCSHFFSLLYNVLIEEPFYLHHAQFVMFHFSDDLEDFDGYQYPKPAIPFPLPSTTTSNPDAETVPTDSARLRKG